MARADKQSDYDIVISEIYKELRESYPTDDVMPFDKTLIERTAVRLAADKKVKAIKNLPDLKYTYDARRNFPHIILNDGYWSITGRGKGQYSLTRLSQNNLIRIPQDLIESEVRVIQQVDRTDPMIAKVLGHDEQATLRRIETNALIEHFLGFQAQRLQGHERTFLSCGQIEVDEVYVGCDGINDYVIPISAKGGHKDFLSFTQALNLSLYTLEKQQFSQYIGRPLGVWQQPNGPIYIIEFNCSNDINHIKIVRANAYYLLKSEVTYSQNLVP